MLLVRVAGQREAKAELGWIWAQEGQRSLQNILPQAMVRRCLKLPLSWPSGRDLCEPPDVLGVVVVPAISWEDELSSPTPRGELCCGRRGRGEWPPSLLPLLLG